MAQITKCDRCGTIDRPTEEVNARGVRVDLCAGGDESCMAAVFGGWLDVAVARVSTVPTVPQPTIAQPWPRPPQHGFTAAAIEAAQRPDGSVQPASGELAASSDSVEA